MVVVVAFKISEAGVLNGRFGFIGLIFRLRGRREGVERTSVDTWWR